MQRRHFFNCGNAEKSKARIWCGDTVTFHKVFVCCFNVQAEREAGRQFVGFTVTVHIKYFACSVLKGSDRCFNLFY